MASGEDLSRFCWLEQRRHGQKFHSQRTPLKRAAALELPKCLGSVVLEQV